ncbi:helix-turn-helix transcriptional regulator [Salmonella enterica]|nr:XRE family transcriptional regulator [Salmonella enterica]EAW1322012.1 XRE family transcriptional regulator [Salmonella enterica subsp. diarizonae]EBG5027211.1 helix-turn-helix transcriptional regulator [Salmonella enterica subsp. enterica serovar Oranienburg]EDX1780651.1 helix-turn-helix transcriptional regulator [Salmonella enterica subsp. enterica serovar Saintpaul]EAM8742018.1 XRE family transcriptional regulator [Salmonella enterica]
MTAIDFNELTASFTPEQHELANQYHEQMKLENQLYLLREALELTQQEQAQALGITQPSVAAIEARGADLKISTLQRYIEALGGHLIIGAVLPGGKQVSFTL